VATLVIRNVENSLHSRLKAQAAAHGQSMEEEARQLLRQGLAPEEVPPAVGFGDAMRALFAPLGGLVLPEIQRGTLRNPPDFSGTEWDTEPPA
jgi:antitoxin FitA